jgi:hypothetical protein
VKERLGNTKSASCTVVPNSPGASRRMPAARSTVSPVPEEAETLCIAIPRKVLYDVPMGQSTDACEHTILVKW